MPHQRAQGRFHLVAAPVQVSSPDGGSQLRFVVKPGVSQGVSHITGRIVEQFTLDDTQHVGRYSGVEIDLTGSRLPHIGLEELRDRSDKFSCRRTAMQCVVRSAHPVDVSPVT